MRKAVFTEAVKVPRADRDRFLDRACGGDAALRGRIKALLQSNARAGGFLEEPAAGEPGKGWAGATWEKPGDRIDRYVLLWQIGEGGCGAVFLAEQQGPYCGGWP